MATPKVFSLFKSTNENGLDTVREYAEVFPDIMTLGRKIDFFLECLSYDVMIPNVVRAEKRLDIFEEAVLKLINAKSPTHKEMAEILCLTEDLINFIVIRLIEMNLLESNSLNLTETGRKVLNIDSSAEDRVEYSQGKIFVIKKTGEILPYIHIGEFKSERVTDYTSKNLTVEFGTIGGAKKIYGKCLRNSGSEKPEPMLQTAKVRNALKRYNMIVKNNPVYERIYYDTEWAISSSLSDNVYLHMQAVIQKGNVDEILVSDGLVGNVDFVNRYITHDFSEFKIYVQEKNSQSAITELNMEKAGKSKNPKYKELDRLWSKVEKDYDELEQIEKISNNKENNVETNDKTNETNDVNVIVHSVNTQDVVRNQRFKQKALLLNAYACFEWCFFSYVKSNPMSDETYKLVSSQSTIQNRKTILEVIKSVGILPFKRMNVLFGVLDESRIRRMYKSNTPEFRCVLSAMVLSILGDDKSLVKKLIRNNKVYFRELFELFSEHGDLSHQSYIPEYDMEKIRIVYKDLRTTIETLLPDFNLKNDANEFKEVELDQISQERLDAIVCLSKELGAMYFNNILSKHLKNEWIQIAPNKTELPDIVDYVEIMYRIAQDTLYQEIMNIRKNIHLSQEDILAKLNEKGIKSKSFDTVAARLIEDSLKNINSSLGANAVIYLYYQNDPSLEELKKLGFVEVIEKLAKLRKHGGNVSLTADLDEMNRIRQNLINIVKYIGASCIIQI